mmetsp:Transcript_29743/g.71624  ORF Transcript_29743/g.71624 Transcript_29743/m.71624 type:complete len:158 (+) Transcript_29743:678-1151(+)
MHWRLEVPSRLEVLSQVDDYATYWRWKTSRPNRLHEPNLISTESEKRQQRSKRKPLSSCLSCLLTESATNNHAPQETTCLIISVPPCVGQSSPSMVEESHHFETVHQFANTAHNFCDNTIIQQGNCQGNGTRRHANLAFHQKKLKPMVVITPRVERP